MKYIPILLCCLLVAQFSIGQTADVLKKRGDSLYYSKDFKNSAIAYSSAIRQMNQADTILVNNTRWAAACSWSLGSYPDSAFILLNKIAATKDLTFFYFIDVISDDDFSSLHKEKRWVELKEKMFLNAKQNYLSMAQKAGGIIPNPTQIAAACAWAMYNKDSAYYYLQMVADAKALFFWGYNNIRTNPLLASLRNDNRWPPLLDVLYKKFETTINTPLDSTYTQEEIIYGRKDGIALTMMHLKPKFNSNHKTIIQVLSGNWRSSLLNWSPNYVFPFLQKGYSVFFVAHGSAPLYSIADEVADLQRAVRFVRYKAKDFEIDPGKIGMTGGSSGGHLSLLCAVMDTITGDNTADPIDRVSSKVQAVVSYSPPTDFLNWEADGDIFFNESAIRQNSNIKVTDTVKMKEILKNLSPLYHVSVKSSPALILHGDKDDVVPMRQSEMFVKKLQESNVPVSLFIKKGAGHGWERSDEELKMVIDWFDKYLK